MGSRTGVAPAFMPALMLFSVLVLAAGTTDVREPPSITMPSIAEDLFFGEGEKVTLNCQASGTPDPVYAWYWNGVQVTSSTNSDISFDGASGSLVIANLDTTKEGFFYCQARNTFPDGITAIAISHKIQVRVARLGPWNVDSTTTTYSGTEGTYKSLPCDDDLPTYYGPIDFKWYIVEGSTQNEHTLDDRQFIDASGTLHFTYLTEADQSASGTFYACALSNTVSGNIQAGSKKKLTVTEDDNINDVPPVVQYSSESVEFNRNGEAKLECFFSGYSRVDGVAEPSPSITWLDDSNNEITTNGRFTVEEEGRLLKIADLVESDEGQYYCLGVNAEGTTTGTVTLNVTSIPIWNSRLEAKTVPQGESAIFMCESRSASGENAPGPPKWYRNGNRLDLAYDSNKFVFAEEKRQMTVQMAQKDSDIACFQCYVSNSVGEEFSNGCLNVILPITIVSQPSPQQQISEGDLVNLTVVATSDPLVPLSYRWIFKNNTYDDPNAPPMVTYDSTTRTAYINTSGFTDDEMSDIAGLYRREVYHTYQKKIVDVDVTLDDPPVVREPPSITISSVAEDMFFRVGAKVTLNCQASGTPDPVYAWYWNGVQVTSSTNSDISFDGANGSLVITDLDTTKEGFFHCQARNTFPDGITAIAISPKIQVRVALVPLAEAGFDYWIIGLIIGILLIIVIIIICCVICRRKMLEGDYPGTLAHMNRGALSVVTSAGHVGSRPSSAETAASLSVVYRPGDSAARIQTAVVPAMTPADYLTPRPSATSQDSVDSSGYTLPDIQPVASPRDARRVDPIRSPEGTVGDPTYSSLQGQEHIYTGLAQNISPRAARPTQRRDRCVCC